MPPAPGTRPHNVQLALRRRAYAQRPGQIAHYLHRHPLFIKKLNLTTKVRRSPGC